MPKEPMRFREAVTEAAQVQKDGKRPNILVTWGDDIGYFL